MGWLARRNSPWQVARYETDIEHWSNSWLGRLLGTGLGVYGIGAGVATTPVNVLVLSVPGSLLLASVWMAKLEIVDGHLMARDFGRIRTIPLDEIVEAEPGAIAGLCFRTRDDRRIRSLVSGIEGNELWTTRGDRICAEIMRRAEAARPA